MNVCACVCIWVCMYVNVNTVYACIIIRINAKLTAALTSQLATLMRFFKFWVSFVLSLSSLFTLLLSHPFTVNCSPSYDYIKQNHRTCKHIRAQLSALHQSYRCKHLTQVSNIQADTHTLNNMHVLLILPLGWVLILRGAGTGEKRLKIFNRLQDLQSDIVLLQEIHLPDSSIDLWMPQFPHVYLAGYNSRQRGVAILSTEMLNDCRILWRCLKT